MSLLADRIQALPTSKIVRAVDLSSIVAEILAACGIPSTDAAAAAEILVEGQLRGSTSHGVLHLPAYVRSLVAGTTNPSPHIAAHKSNECTVVIDADNALGVLAGKFTVDLLVPIARRFGLGAAAVRNSNHFGIAGYFAERATKRGLICLAMSNASPTMAPFGSTRALLGTNPIAAGLPLPGADPIVVDLSTSAVARARIRQAERDKTPIPADWALDIHGNPTTNPTDALKGTIQPLGGAKGYGLALMVELLSSALSDGRPGSEVVSPHDSLGKTSGVSHFFLLMDPASFCGVERYGARASAIVEQIRSAPGIDGGAPVRLPGERGHAARSRHRKEGILLTQSLLDALTSAAKLIGQPRAEAVSGAGSAR